MEDMTFKQWMRELNLICMNKLCVSIHDLPDMMFRDAYDNEISPQEFFNEEVRATVEEDFGSLVDGLF